jgi:1,4-alpha-glucan branching enzyme
MDAVQIVVPNSSTWGANGYNEVWLNGKNDWIYRQLDEMTERMIRLATIHKNTSNPNIEAALNQMARELLLAQSSDWAFIITTGTTVEYAENRTKFFLNNFMNIEKEVNDDNIDKKYIEKLNWLDAIFPKIDFRVFAKH